MLQRKVSLDNGDIMEIYSSSGCAHKQLNCTSYITTPRYIICVYMLLILTVFFIIRYKVFLGRILCEFLPEFKFLSDLVLDYTPSLYEEEMSSRSLIILFPVLMKDEKKYADIVHVLDQLEVWLDELYANAGLCQPLDATSALPSQTIQGSVSARPGQPQAHVPPVRDANDPLPAVPCFGDQLTRVQLAGATLLRTDWTIFIHFE